MVEPDSNQPKVYLTELQQRILIEEVYEKIKRDLFNKKVQFDGVYGIPRGGTVLALYLSHRLGLPLLKEPTEQSLLADDISDSGKTLKQFKGKKIATLFMRYNTETKPDYYAHELKDNTWVCFPYEYR